jgi:hydrogenase maturation protease
MAARETLVLGIGNTITGNDGVGIFTVRALRKELASPACEIIETQETGINLLGTICGYRKAVIIDSIRTGKGRPGNIYKLTQDDFKKGRSLYSSHQIGLATVLELARELNLDVPEQIIIYAVEIEKEGSFGESLTEPVNSAVFKLVDLIKGELVC